MPSRLSCPKKAVRLQCLLPRSLDQVSTLDSDPAYCSIRKNQPTTRSNRVRATHKALGVRGHLY
ncbi:hypothetical protein M407DRAFT_241316 [Tulasnella calospora MUT 4182]|uniref:Uncharacterized protein n=1 Tax=Tulasnella calospora MUT 4182 TaxID=1051891 RepID=A0A0C3LF47_9AGAM|nr:hypothetical protein M407DRAFT_241316 [Tulasnella calospora MUT 4182]